VAIPELEDRCGSWVVVRDGKAVRETFVREFAEIAQGEGYEVLTAMQWLGRVNGRASA
jgi:predicted alpha/beta hydrolase